MKKNLAVNADRLWESLMEMAKIGGTEKGGVCRLALSDEDKAARDLFVRWCKEAGCTVTIDQMGNIFGRRPGRNDSLPPIMAGSHIDSQPTGGRFDGIYGVMAGLEVIRALNDAGFETEAPIEVAAWTNEEGSRFAPAMIASGVFGGEFTLDYGLSRADKDGKTIGEELKRIGYAGDAKCGGRKVGGFFEAHIEQGPILEADKKTIGIVQGVQGMRWYELTVTGMESHAGTTPMPCRRDALVGASRMVSEAHRIGMAQLPNGRSTVGMMQVTPNSRNTIPGKVFFTVDLRHPDADTLKAMGEEFQDACEAVAHELRLELDFKEIWYSPPVKFDAQCVAAVENAAQDLGFAHEPIISGAGHDAVYLSRVAPTAMVFIPCEDGISHNEVEAATKQDCAAGAQVLLLAMVERANAT
ncbi:MAG: Zn-dependent hydrolase [Alphaproteobacteria bacterium]